MYKAEKDTTSKTCKAAANMFTALQQVSHRTRIDSIKPQECRVDGWREALRVVWGFWGARSVVLKAIKSVQPYRKALRTEVLGGSEGSPKGRKKSTKPYRKALRAVRQAA